MLFVFNMAESGSGEAQPAEQGKIFFFDGIKIAVFVLLIVYLT